MLRELRERILQKEIIVKKVFVLQDAKLECCLQIESKNNREEILQRMAEISVDLEEVVITLEQVVKGVNDLIQGFLKKGS